MQGTFPNGIARLRNHCLQSRPTWPHALERHFRIEEKLRNSQDFPRILTSVPGSPIVYVLARAVWRQSSHISIRDANAVQPCSGSTLLACETSRTGSKPITMWSNPLSFVIFVVHSATATSATVSFWRSAQSYGQGSAIAYFHKYKLLVPNSCARAAVTDDRSGPDIAPRSHVYGLKSSNALTPFSSYS